MARGTAECLSFGATGIIVGKRFPASRKSNIAKGYQNAVIKTRNSGSTKVTTCKYSQMGETTWPNKYNGGGTVNKSPPDAQGHKSTEVKKAFYSQALGNGDGGWEASGRLATYAESVVELVKEGHPACDIVDKLRRDAAKVLAKLARTPSRLWNL
ncbi:hypothetical protein MMC21_004645 [Puttea exsequens]|nr:hypothetical protein [Puttea exsequens]